MPVHRLTEKEELLESDRICSIAFVSPWDREEAIRGLESPDFQPTVSFGHFTEEGQLTASLLLPQFQMRYEGHDVPMVGVGGVASLPEYRYGGAVRQIFHTALEWMWDQGAVFSSLYPFSHNYYRKFGYELCQLVTQYKLPTEALESFSCTCKVRMFQPGEDLAPLQAVYNARLGQYNLAVQREERHWKSLFGKDPAKEMRYTYLLEDAGGPLAYVIFKPEEGEDGKIGNVRELAFAKPEGLRQALGFLYRLGAQYEAFRIALPEDVPLAALLEESYDTSPTWINQPMARVIHVEKALQAKAPGEGRSYTVAVEDQLLPGNNGVFQVSQQGGAVTVEKLPEGAQADLSMDVRVLTQLLIGFLSLEEALYKPGVTLSGNLETLHQAFPKRAAYLTDLF